MSLPSLSVRRAPACQAALAGVRHVIRRVGQIAGRFTPVTVTITVPAEDDPATRHHVDRDSAGPPESRRIDRDLVVELDRRIRAGRTPRG